MQEVSKRAVTVVLAAVVVFMMAFPVPIKGLLLERATYEQARANPAIAVPVILGTALAAAGVYVAGTSASQYNGNLDSVYQGLSNGTQWYSNAWSTYVQEKGSFDAAMQSVVTEEGAISLKTLSDAGFFDTVNSYTAYCVEQGTAVTGISSVSANSTALQFGNYSYSTFSALPSGWDEFASGYVVLAIFPSSETDNWKSYYIVRSESFTDANAALNVSINNDGGLNLPGTLRDRVIYVTKATGEVSAANRWNSRSNPIYYSWGAVLNGNLNWTMGNQEVPAQSVSTSEMVLDANGVGVDSALLESDYVEPFTPTAEQLAEGFTTADVVEAINSGNETTSGIADDVAALLPAVQGLAGLLSPLAGIATTLTSVDGNVSSILSNVAGLATAPFSWLQSWWNTLSGWWSTLLAWLGATPFGNVMGTVISGVQAIPGAIDGAASDVLGGIAAIPGALEGWLEGILDGVLSIPGSIAGVIEGIQQAVSDMAGAIEGIFEPFIRPTMPVDTGGTVSIALPPGLFEAEKFDLSEKVPFCYLIRTQGALTSMFSNFATYRSFYFDLDIPSAGTIRFDGEPVLSQRFGAFDIANTIKGLATGLLCLGLLYRAYRVFERQMGGA